jgi:hypothetical protein
MGALQSRGRLPVRGVGAGVGGSLMTYSGGYFAVLLFKVSSWLFNHAVCKTG